ncbi:MAG: alpha-L-arabinofuranosidase [Verrucomicrobia bacterium Tous-C9LFEB]|nr:MAG: alpha-L-arabinofuranosidase [Verrucomicrobia bacterium Tous-C9LFEB]
MRSKWYSITLALIGLCTIQAIAAGEPEVVQIRIQAEGAGVPVNPKIFGHFMKGADNYGIFSASKPDLAVLHEGDGVWNPETRAPYPQPFQILQSYRPGALRYPDGLGVHNHDWKKTIGPVESRGEWKFGLNEFMQICEQVKADPIFVVSEYIGTPQDAADLVEYLNMPAEERYPWALKRAADGHPAPYKVKYFEMGNESWVDWRKFGKTNVRPAPEVGKYASALAKAMKAVDPTIRCGVPYGEGDWNRGVLGAITKDIDFVVVHSYPVKYGGKDLTGLKEKLMLESMLTSGYEMVQELAEIRGHIREFSGRAMPIFITEYNMGPTQMQSGLERPYRYTLAAALGTGDFLGRLMQPGEQVEAAIYWSWLNGFFESVHTYAEHPMKSLRKLDEPLLRPVHFIFQLWARYRGEELLSVQNDSPRVDFPGFTRMNPCLGSESREAVRLDARNIIEGARVLKSAQPGVTPTISPEGEWSIRLENQTRNAFPNLLIKSLADIPASLRPPVQGLVYKISFDAIWEPEEGSMMPNLGIGLGDSRGWQASGSAIGTYGIQGAKDWKHFEEVYQPMPDTEGLVILARIEGGTTPITGVVKIKNLRVEAWSHASYPARPALTSYATRSADRKKLYLTVFNLTSDRDFTGQITWSGFKAKRAKFSEVNAASVASVNSKEVPTVWKTQDAALPLSSADRLIHVFPAHSATGIELVVD